ncbi:hypothetical protein CONPUDRAFT_54412, partial [Coniophora puteana RWD-64-598 SS2]
MHLGRINMMKKLTGKMKSLDDHKKFDVAVAHSEFLRVDVLCRACIKRGMSAKAMIGLLNKAVNGLYKPKGVTETELLRAKVFSNIAGSRALQILHRSTGALSDRTVRRHTVTPPLWVLVAAPTVEEVQFNVSNTFGGGGRDMPTGAAVETSSLNVPGYQLMIDKIKVEGRPRWDDKTNMILGVAREDALKVGLEFSSMAEVDALLDAIKGGDVRLAVEATVAAIGLLSDNSKVYAARPVVVSGTCKTEDAMTHAKLIQTVIDGCKNVPGCLYSLASDGEARRGAAFVRLTHKAKLSPNSPIYAYIGLLHLLNQLVGDDDITSDKDYKHIFKCLRNALLREMGIMIYGFHMQPSVLEFQLCSAGVPPHQVSYLLNPEDKQDVILAYKLLRHIWRMPPAGANTRPGFASARKYICILGDFFRHLISPYIDPKMSLRDQLFHLSVATHLMCSLYMHPAGGNAFLPKVLHTDIQIMIKNTFFSVAKAKVNRPCGEFYIILLGTDRLEVTFGYIRSVVGSNANTDIYQLGGRIAALTNTAQILADHSEWDSGTRRLHLPPLDSEEDITSKSDHVNPASWQGNVNVQHVLPVTAWNKG